MASSGVCVAENDTIIKSFLMIINILQTNEKQAFKADQSQFFPPPCGIYVHTV